MRQIDSTKTDLPVEIYLILKDKNAPRVAVAFTTGKGACRILYANANEYGSGGISTINGSISYPYLQEKFQKDLHWILLYRNARRIKELYGV